MDVAEIVELLQSELQYQLKKKYCDEKVLSLLSHGKIITITSVEL